MKTRVGIILYLGEIVQDIWESEDPKEVLRNFAARTVGKIGWRQGLGDFTASAYVMSEHDEGVFDFVVRSMPITIGTPPKCRTPRPCAEGFDLLAWFTTKQAEPAPVEAEPAAWLSPAEVAHAEVPADEQIAADADAAAHVSLPLERLRHHVTGAIERGETAAIVEKTPTPVEAEPAAWLSPAEVAHAEVPADEQIAADADAAAHVSLPLERLRHHVTGAIERGETAAIVEKTPTPVFDFSTKKGVRAYWAAQRGART